MFCTMYIHWTLLLELAAVLASESAWNGFQGGGIRHDSFWSFNKPHYNFQPSFQQNLRPFRVPSIPATGSVSLPETRFGGNVPNVVSRQPPTATMTSTTSSTTVKSTTISTTTINVPNTKSLYFEFCVKKCRITQELKPVCGSDGVTYKNPSILKCARDCGIDVFISKPGRCEINDDGCTATKTTEASVTPSSEIIRACIVNCPSTTEFNPVCGSNGVTYDNRGRLECAKSCGVDVTLSRYSKCPTNGASTTSPPSATTSAPVTPSMEVIRACMANCPITTEYNPVCGSNKVTYNNPSHLECAKICGINVEVTRFSRCPVGGITSRPATNATPKPTTLTLSTISTSSLTTDTPPRPTTPSLLTTSTTTSIIEPTLRPTTPSVTPITDAQTPTSGNLNFTISQGILDQIFTTDYGGLIDERHED